MAGYKHLISLSQTLEKQMNSLETHLESIIECLFDIEDRLREGQRVKEKFFRQKKEKAAKCLNDASEQLIEACNTYLTLTDRNGDGTKAIEN